MTDPILPLLTAPAQPGPSQPMKYRAGTVLSFDQNTLANTIDVGGSVMTNLPLLGVAESSSLVEGATVGLIVIESTLGTTTYAIIGRLVEPETDEAVAAISLLSSWIASESIAVQETTNLTTYGDLTTVGPTVEFNVRPSGRILIIATSQSQQLGSGAITIGGYYSIEMSGANVVSPDQMEANTSPYGSFLGTSKSGFNGAFAWVDQKTITVVQTLEGLAPGLTVARMKYRSLLAGHDWDFGRRSLAVITL